MYPPILRLCSFVLIVTEVEHACVRPQTGGEIYFSDGDTLRITCTVQMPKAAGTLYFQMNRKNIEKGQRYVEQIVTYNDVKFAYKRIQLVNYTLSVQHDGALLSCYYTQPYVRVSGRPVISTSINVKLKYYKRERTSKNASCCINSAKTCEMIMDADDSMGGVEYARTARCDIEPPLEATHYFHAGSILHRTCSGRGLLKGYEFWQIEKDNNLTSLLNTTYNNNSNKLTILQKLTEIYDDTVLMCGYVNGQGRYIVCGRTHLIYTDKRNDDSEDKDRVTRRISCSVRPPLASTYHYNDGAVLNATCENPERRGALRWYLGNIKRQVPDRDLNVRYNGYSVGVSVRLSEKYNNMTLVCVVSIKSMSINCSETRLRYTPAGEKDSAPETIRHIIMLVTATASVSAVITALFVLFRRRRRRAAPVQTYAPLQAGVVYAELALRDATRDDHLRSPDSHYAEIIGVMKPINKAL